MTLGGISNLMRVEAQQVAMAGLGYPAYLMTILGVAKIAGIVALLIPGTPLLKEWAYAGFAFDLLGASASHAFSGHGFLQIFAPLFVLLFAIASYSLRPGSRRLQFGPVSGKKAEERV